MWIFRGALQGENLFSLHDAGGDWEKKGSYRTAWAVLCVPDFFVHMRMDMAPLSGRTLDSGAGHCLPVCGGLSHP